ncbi:hypothetical protein AGMMS50230_09260 [Spirochaetia bacterium]|nr:hypothetical protein AGMMS50230_09260 [Spirochaetia bacterium]
MGLTRDDIFLKAPYKRFKEFVCPGIDRFALLCSVLEENALPFEVLKLAEKRHIVLSSGFTKETAVIFTAHYDRTLNSPGANDNGAAVFQLVETALRISGGEPSLRRGPAEYAGNGADESKTAANGALFIFTDGEELSCGENLQHQGSYNLGLYLREKGLGDGRIFTFDACGAGDTLIISTAADELLKQKKGPGAETARRKVGTLRGAALEAARFCLLEKVMLLPTPFSEDAGFLLAGMAAQTITVLPQSEAAAFASLVRRRGNSGLYETKTGDLLSAAPAESRLIPETWRSLNGPADSPLRLTPEHWKTVTAFATALAE